MAKEKRNRWYNNGWILGIGTTIIASPFADMLSDKVKSIPILSYFIKLLTWLWQSILSIFTYRVSVWFVLTIIVAVFAVKKLVDKIKKVEIPEYSDYNEGVFFNWIWKWEYKFDNVKGKWSIINLRPFCPNCNTMLLNNSTYIDIQYNCPRCNDNYSKRGIYNSPAPEDKRKIEALIIDNIEKKHY
jgi:phage FluMu protein Com